MLRPHHSKVLKRVQRHACPAEVPRLYHAHSLLATAPNAVNAFNEAWQRSVEMLEQGIRAAAAAAVMGMLAPAALPAQQNFPFPSAAAGHLSVERFLHNAIRDVREHAL